MRANQLVKTSSPTLERNLPFTRDQRSCSIFAIALNFSFGSREFSCWWEHRALGLPGAASPEACFGQSSAVRREAVGHVFGLLGKLREASAYSTDYPELARGAV